MGLRAIGVGLVLLVNAGPAIAADASAERSQPTTSVDSGTAIATAGDGQTNTEITCSVDTCGSPATPQADTPARLSTATRKTPWLGLSTSNIVPMEERKLGLRLLRGLYATVSLVPARPLLDPVPTDVHTTDRVRVGLGCMLRF